MVTTGSRWRAVASWVVLLLGCALTFLAWRYVTATVHGETEALLEHRADEAKREVEQHLRVHAEVLRGLQGLFMHRTEQPVTRADFRRYVASLDGAQRYPGIQALAFVRYVRHSDARAFEAQVRNDLSAVPLGLPGFAIKPAGERADYFVVEFIEPSAGGRPAFGFDMGSETDRRRTLELARDSGGLAATGPIRLFMEPPEPTGFVLAAPVYRTGASLDSVAQRRAAFVGWVAAIFRTNDFMRGLFGPQLLGGLDIELFDSGGAAGGLSEGNLFAEENLFFDSATQIAGHAMPLHALEKSARLQKTVTVQVVDRTWLLVATALPEFKGGQADALLPPLVLVVGLALAALLAALTRSLAVSGLRAEQTAHRLEERFTRLVDSLNDVIWSLTLPDLRVEFISPSAQAVSGHAPARFYADPGFWPTLIHAEDRAGVMDMLAAVQQDGSAQVECRLRRAEGTYSWAHVRARLVHDERGAPLRIDGIITDVTARRLAEAALRESEEKFRNILESAADGIVITDGDGRIVNVNRRAEALFGYGREELLGQSVEALVPSQLRDRHRARRHGAEVEHRRVMARQVEAQRKDGSVFTAEVTLSTTHTKQGPLVTSIVRDTTESRRMIETLRLRERAIASSANGIMITDASQPDHPIIYVNPAFERITGYPAQEALGRNGRFLVGEDREQPGLAEVRAALHERREGQAVLRNYRKDGSMVWNELSLAPVRDEAGRVTHYVSVFNDVTERKRYERELEYQASRDSLTGLANRALLNDRLAQAVAYARREERQFAVAFIDLDHFKVVNDSLGHSRGDALLREVAQRLGPLVREGDTVARLGGDEFVIVLYGIDGTASLPNALQRILDALSHPFMLEGNELFVTCSIGATIYPQDGQDPETLLRNADLAMYQAKEQGRNGYRFYTAEMNLAAGERLTLERELRHAIQNDEFTLFYQPLVDLVSGQIAGAEALIRWQHPQRGIVPPDRFIPLAEETGLIIPIGEWVLRTACTQNKAWLERGLAVPVAVNLSARQFRQPNLARQIGQIVRECGLPPHLLELELTESMVMEHPGDVIAALAELRALGLRLALDDFGTGYSSLSRLKHLPIDTLKIDRAFVQDITSNADDAAIAVSVISLAHTLNRRVVAEGVETEAQLKYLRSRHCDVIQGYFFSRPVPAEAFTRLLAERKSLAPDGESGQRTLLLLDDEENVLKALTRTLRRDNYRILTAGTASAAFELLACHKVQVIISDQRMPEMNGTEFLERVKDLHPETVRIVLSGYTDLQTVTDAVNRGAVYRFMTKPWDDDLLRENVREAFRRFEYLAQSQYAS